MSVKQILISIVFFMFIIGFIPKADAYDKQECERYIKELQVFNRDMDKQFDEIEREVIDFHDAIEGNYYRMATEYKISIIVDIESMIESHTSHLRHNAFDILGEIKDHCEYDTYKLERKYIQESKALRKFARDIKRVYDRFESSYRGSR